MRIFKALSIATSHKRGKRTETALGVIAAAAIVSMAVPQAAGAIQASARPHTAAAAKAAFEATKRGKAEQRALAIARSRHGMPPGIPVPAWALKPGSHVNFTVSPTALLHRHQRTEQDKGASTPRGPKDPDSAGGLALPNGPGGAPQAGNGAGLRVGEVPPIRYLGGFVQHNPTVHLLFWGSNWSGHTSELLQFFQGLSNSSYQGILTQYFDSTGYIANKVSVNSLVDSSVGAPAGVNEETLEAELASAESAWGPPNLETQYVILPAPGSTYEAGFAEGFCAFHSVAPSGAIYSFVPYEGDEPFANKTGCVGYGNGDGSKATTVVASHEYAESATDPLWDTAPGWRNRAEFEGEISDICATEGDLLESGVMVQGQYDDHLAKCTISDPSPPHVLGLTEPATNVTNSTATLNATVNAEGSSTTYQFEWGSTASYGQSLPVSPVGVGSGWSDVHVSQPLAGLQPEHVYHYRVVATNSSGVTYGEDHTAIPSHWEVTTPVLGPWTVSWLRDVSCASETWCMTVGYYYQPGLSPEPNQALAYKKSGSNWVLSSVPQSEGEAWPGLEGVSCPSGGVVCVAVGEGTVGGHRRPLIVRWNGSSWITEHVTLPAGTIAASLLDVKCLSPQAQECIAVGTRENTNGVWVNYTALYANGTWSSLSTPTEEATSVNEVTGVDCFTTLSTCIAVGWYNPADGGASKPFSLKMSAAGQWEFQPRNWTGFLEGVTCNTYTYTQPCIAVGIEYGAGPSTETWTGSAWLAPSIASTPDVLGGYLAGVSCRAFAECTAVGAGWSLVNGATTTLSEQLAGEPWGERTTPRESEVAPNVLESVECFWGQCYAVGFSKASDSYRALLEVRGRDTYPAVFTEEPSGVEASGNAGRASLHGTVDPNGGTTEYHFEWGTQAEYNKGEYNHVVPFPDGAVGSGLVGVPVSQTMSPLAGQTTYYYRLVAKNPTGTTTGTSRSFTTPDWRPQIGEEAAVAVSHSEATLGATINPSGFKTTYHFKWGTQAEYEKGKYAHAIPIPDETVGEGIQGVAVKQGPLTGLSAGATYHFRLVASSSQGTVESPDESFTTLAPCKGAEGKCEWKAQSSPDLSRSEHSLAGVSCASASLCMGVGNDGLAGTGNAQLWDGSKWANKLTLGQSTAGVSCPATNWCMAVGVSKSAPKGFLLKEAGSVWSLETTTPPVPSGGSKAVLKGISCTASTACTAVGSYYVESESKYKTLVERWNGTSWSTQTSTNPASGSAENAMLAVSCSSSTSCLTVGTANNAPFAESWNGTTWSTQTIPAPSPSVEATLTGISCTSSTACTAVGTNKESSVKGFYKKPLAERWNGTSWSIQTVPSPSEAKGIAKLSGVSCTTSTACTAVGLYAPVTGENPAEQKTLAESWNGTAWSVQTSPNSAQKVNGLSAVSCTSSTACTAVGSDQPVPWAEPGGKNENQASLAERLSGSEWKVQETPGQSRSSYSLSNVSCASTSMCWAVGADSNTGNGVGELWDGTTWTKQAGFVTSAADVSCPTTTWCMVVGIGKNETPQAWRLQKEGSVWNVFSESSLVTPSGGSKVVPRSVSCTSSTACTAVGSYYVESEAKYKTLVERWNGTSWSVQMGGVSGYLEAMQDVSCPTSTSCLAVGTISETGVGYAFAEVWNGSSWSTALPLSPGSLENRLDSASCPTSSYCIAVGYYKNTGKGQRKQPLAERWNGSSWVALTVPSPADAKGDVALKGISCSTTYQCTAVGSYWSNTEGSEEKTLVAYWDGATWTVQASPNSAQKVNALTGVSCASAIACTAVGASEPELLSSLNKAALVGRYE